MNKKDLTKSNKEPLEDGIDEYRSTPLYAILFCGIIIIIIGLWLLISNTSANGLSLPNKYGTGGGQIAILNGPFTILIGIILIIFPSLQLIRKSIRK